LWIVVVVVVVVINHKTLRPSVTMRGRGIFEAGWTEVMKNKSWLTNFEKKILAWMVSASDSV
jgi:hypothetical protein